MKIAAETAHGWKKGLSDERRCGSCLFVSGGWEHRFSDGHVDTEYFCMLRELIFSDSHPPIAVIERYENDLTPTVFHYQKACLSYYSVREYELKEIDKESFKELPYWVREHIERERCCDDYPVLTFFVIKKNTRR